MELREKIMIFIISALIPLSGCTKKTEDSFGQKKTIVCTVFPQFDWISNIIEGTDTFQTSCLLTKGTDLHSYQPAVADMVKISTADLFIYVGGESDFWVEDALHNAKNKNIITVNLVELLGDKAKLETEIPGAQEEKSHEETEEAEYDEHVWLSVKNAYYYSKKLCEIICKMDPDNAEKYISNTQSFCTKLEECDRSFSDIVSSARNPVIIVADRFPFLYFAEDYNLQYFAAFAGCSAESEASFATVINLANILTEQNLSTVFTLENSSPKIANQIIENTPSKTAEIRILNSMQSVSEKDIIAGTTYLSLMEENIEALKMALES